MSRQLAIMKEVGFGCRDIGRPILFFTTYVSEYVAALQIIPGDEALDIIQKSGVYDIHKLEGKPCWVEVNDNIIVFLSIAEI